MERLRLLLFLLLRLLPFLSLRQRKTVMGDCTALLFGFFTLTIVEVTDADSQEGLKHLPPIRVTTVVSVPYISKEVDKPTKNEDFVGYFPEVLNKIGEQLHREYIIQEVGDGHHGNKIPGTNEWNGVYGELLAGTADLAGCDLTITEFRKEIVDFTEPLFSVRTVVLMQRQSKEVTTLEELVDQEDMTVGVLHDPTIMGFISNSTLPYYQKIASAFTANPDGLVIDKAAEGVRKIRTEKGKFAFILDSVLGLYWGNQPPCDLVKLEANFPQQGLGLAVLKDSELQGPINAAISQLRENGELVRIKQKWWKNHCLSSGSFNSWAASIVLPLLSTIAPQLRLNC